MVITFWGVRGSIPVPGQSTTQYGGNTPCVTIEHEDTLLIIDCGTGLRELGQKLMAESNGKPINAHILISHTHWDHIQGFPFFTPAFIPANTFEIYGVKGVNRQIEDILSGQMDSPYFPVPLETMSATLHFNAIEQHAFTVDGLTITPCFLNHPGLALGFRISCGDGDVVYFSDHEPYYRMLTTPNNYARAAGPPVSEEERMEFAHRRDAEYIKFCENADLLIEDSPYTVEEYPPRVGWGHACVDDVVAIAIKSNVKQLALFHHEPGHSDKDIDTMVEYCRTELIGPDSKLNCFAAREGEQVVIPGEDGS